MTTFTWVTKACGVFLLWAAAAVALPAQTFTSLLSFDETDGCGPHAGLVQGTNGDFFGTTSGCGGTNGDGDGTVFKITTSGALTTLQTFDYVDGSAPTATLAQDTNGTFYGTTALGGPGGYGTVFKITPSGTLTTLYDFCSQANCIDGALPNAGLIQATNGDFYGTTSNGGSNNNLSICTEDVENEGCGTVFKITPNGTLTTLYNFCSKSNCTDGALPGGLVQGTDGKLYGTTEFGGASGYGTAFKITPSGTLTTLYNFCSQNGCTDGAYPQAPLV
jgi:uncharacterized repeat protein (TIGR03803 family)